MRTSILRPGHLVFLSTSVTGNVSYFRTEIEPEHEVDGGAMQSRWETERKIADAKEHAAALKVQQKAGGMIRAACTKSKFGYLCSEEKIEDLRKIVAEAQELVRQFNATSKLSVVSVEVLTGQIAPTEQFAVRAINSEISQLMRDMESGLAKLDVKAVREAADKAREVSAMLTDGAQARVQIAVDTGRKAAREIAKAEREKSTPEIDKLAITKITEMRTSFLDFSDAAPVQNPDALERALDLGYGVEQARA